MKQPTWTQNSTTGRKEVILPHRILHDPRDDKPIPDAKSTPEQGGEFLTPEQRQQIVAGILATIALRVVRNNNMPNSHEEKLSK